MINRHTFLVLLIIVFTFLSGAACSGKKENNYVNKKYGYSLNFPRSWFVGSLGEVDSANVVWFVSDKEDVRQADGGRPVGAKVEIIVQDLDELRKMDPRFPEIKGAKEWLAWERSGYSKFNDGDAGVMQGVKDEKTTVAGKPAIQTICDGVSAENPDPSIQITLFDSPIVFQIKYLGSEPDYGRNIPVFEQIKDSLKLK